MSTPNQDFQKYKTSESIEVNIGGLRMHIISRDSSYKITTPPIFEQFIAAKSTNMVQKHSLNQKSTEHDHEMLLKVNGGDLNDIDPEENCLFSSESWMLWENESGQFIFSTKPQKPKVFLKIKSDFSEGEIFSNFRPKNGESFYPLKSLDIRLFSNWLGMYGDIILHASGVITSDGYGICFAGSSGAGKSTLVKSLYHRHSIEVLGEDHLILRYLNGQFFVFGSPWHEDPAMCTPKGVLLKKLFFLDRQAKPGIHSLKPIKGVFYLLKTAFIPYYRQDLLPRILKSLTHLSDKVPFFTLNYRLGNDVWESIKLVQP